MCIATSGVVIVVCRMSVHDHFTRLLCPRGLSECSPSEGQPWSPAHAPQWSILNRGLAATTRRGALAHAVWSPLHRRAEPAMIIRQVNARTTVCPQTCLERQRFPSMRRASFSPFLVGGALSARTVRRAKQARRKTGSRPARWLRARARRRCRACSDGVPSGRSACGTGGSSVVSASQWLRPAD
jgi:hypothetical protein